MSARRTTAAILMAAATLTACTQQRVITTPGPYIDSHHPAQATFTQVDGTKSVLFAPKIFSDTVMAFKPNGTNLPEQVMVPLPQVQSITVKSVNAPRTLGLIGIGMGGLVAFAATHSGLGKAGNPSCAGKTVGDKPQPTSCRVRPTVSVPAMKVVSGIAHVLTGN